MKKGAIIDWSEIEEKIKSISVLKTFEKHLDPKEQAVIGANVKQVREIHRVYSDLLKRIPWSSISVLEESFLKVACILFSTEGILSFGMNIVIYALILKEHHDIWLEWKKKFVSSYDELSDVPLAVRLKFLEKHGFEFFSEICPKDIRNAIAHMNFNIDSDGTIHMQKCKKYTKEELEKKIFDVVKMVNLFNRALTP